MQEQDKQDEIRVHLEKIKHDGLKNYHSSGWGPKKMHNALKYLYSFTNKNKKYKVLDLGIGGANLAKYIIQNPQFEVTGLDLVREVIDEITSKRVNIPLICGDAEKMPFKDETFDIIIHNQTVHHFPDTTLVLKEINRVLKKDGLLMSIETNGWNPIVWYGHNMPWNKKKRFISSNQKVFSLPKYKSQLEKTGFKILGEKMVNFQYFPESLQDTLNKVPIFRLFYAGSMVVCSQTSN